MTKKKELTLQDIFNQNNELYKNIIDCFIKLEAKIDNVKGEYYGGETIDLTNIHAALAKHFGITDKDYITITADDVLVGGESVREYNGQDIYNYYHLLAYFKEIRDMMQEKEIRLLEIHCLQSSTDGEFVKTGNPIPDKNGCNAWCRVVWEDNHGNKTTGSWVFYDSYSSAADCAGRCADRCADGVRIYSAFRAAVFGAAD